MEDHSLPLQEKNKKPRISVISPVYLAERCIDELIARLMTTLEKIAWDIEIILVEDASPDGSWAKIEESTKKDPRIMGLRLSRNFGQHSAITAGIEQASGEWIVVMDCDLQDQPEEIPKLLEKAKEGFDIVLASRKLRRDGFIQSLVSRMFYRVLSFLTGVCFDPTVANFGIYHQKVIHAITKMPEKIRFFPALINWVGFRSTKISVNHAARTHGKSSYTFKKRLKLALDIILAYSDKPLRFIVALGLLISSAAFLLGAYVFYRYITGQIDVLGYASLFVSLCFFSGVIITVIGMIGLYVGKIFDGIKNRPSYLIMEKTGNRWKKSRSISLFLQEMN